MSKLEKHDLIKKKSTTNHKCQSQTNLISNNKIKKSTKFEEENQLKYHGMK